MPAVALRCRWRAGVDQKQTMARPLQLALSSLITVSQMRAPAPSPNMAGGNQFQVSQESKRISGTMTANALPLAPIVIFCPQFGQAPFMTRF